MACIYKQDHEHVHGPIFMGQPAGYFFKQGMKWSLDDDNDWKQIAECNSVVARTEQSTAAIK